MMFRKATRNRSHLWIAISSPSGAGKTFSALLMARGIQRVFPGPVRGIDTEHGRMSHYAREFDFDVEDFLPPHSSERYQQMIAAACTGMTQGERFGPPASVVIVDSMTHEHTGDGGYKDFHVEEEHRLMKLWDTPNVQQVQWAAWSRPAEARRLMVDGILATGATNIIFCFRAKKTTEKVGKKVIDIGYMPVGARDLVFEMTVRAHLPVGSDGRPDWSPSAKGECAIVKRPKYARAIDMSCLNEHVGECLAQWALGDTEPANETTNEAALPLIAQLRGADSRLELDELEDVVRQRWDTYDVPTQKALDDAGREAHARIGQT